ncbi:MAG: hypothetical protein V4487_07710 [Chlamydiota bacterium]
MGIALETARMARNAVLSPSEKESRKFMSSLLNITKTAAAVAMAVVLLFIVLFPSIFTFILLLPVGFVAYEIFTVSKNFNEILDNPFVEAKVRISEQALIDKLSDQTFFTKTILTNFPPAKKIIALGF